jgi:hypothetical protein
MQQSLNLATQQSRNLATQPITQPRNFVVGVGGVPSLVQFDGRPLKALSNEIADIGKIILKVI